METVNVGELVLVIILSLVFSCGGVWLLCVGAFKSLTGVLPMHPNAAKILQFTLDYYRYSPGENAQALLDDLKFAAQLTGHRKTVKEFNRQK